MKRIRKIGFWILSLILMCGIVEYEVRAEDETTGDLSLGYDFSAVIKEDGSLWTCGWGQYGQLGNGSTSSSYSPKKILDGAKQVSLGGAHGAVIKEDGSLWMWGLNDCGQLGDGTTNNTTTPKKILDNVKQVSLGYDFSAVIKEDGTLWMWGQNDDGQLGDGTTSNAITPKKILTGVKYVSLGGSTSAVIKEDGSLWTWGWGRYGQRGDGTENSSSTPKKIMENIKQVSLGTSHCAAIKENGTLWMWGSNDWGQLANNTGESAVSPIQVLTGVKQVSLGMNGTVAVIKENGSLWTWGWGSNGERGDGSKEDSSTPVKILENVKQVSLGSSHCAAIKEDGSVWMWGTNIYGELGDGTGDASLIPKEILSTIVTYSVTYNANGGSGAPSSQTKYYGKTLTLSSTKPTRTGYTFQGWGTSSSDTSVNYDLGDSYTSNSDITLYAIWKLKTYTITYNANNGTGAPSSQTKYHGTALTLSNTKPTRTGYTFQGWGISSGDTSVDYDPGDSYTSNSDITLYAIWKPLEYTVKYNANGGSGAPSSQIKYYGTVLTLSGTKPTRTGYTFQGWGTSSSDTSVDYDPGDSYTPNSGITLYAIWKPLEYNVTYNANGGSGAPSSQTKYYGTALALSNTIPARTGYIFQGWGTSNSDTSVDYDPGDNYTSNSNITLYAIWKPLEYIVFFDDNGGSGAPSNQIKYHGKTLLISNIEPTKTGYDFVGWGDSTEDTEPVYQPGDKYTSNSNKTLYALWKIKKYKITYNANGGSGAPSSQTKYYGKTLTLRTKKPTRTNHIFQGWSTTKTAVKATYKAGGTYKANKAITLYAVWKKNQTITASSKTVAYNKAPFNLNAKASGGGKLTYTSSNKQVVTVSAAGKVTVKGYGKATITIKAAAKGKYLAASKKITIEVVPKKQTITSLKSPSKKQMVIKWNKDTTVTGYHIYVSLNKDFARNTIERLCGKNIASTDVPLLKSGKSYYVKVRSYKTVNGTKYYGAWSTVKSVKVK